LEIVLAGTPERAPNAAGELCDQGLFFAVRMNRRQFSSASSGFSLPDQRNRRDNAAASASGRAEYTATPAKAPKVPRRHFVTAITAAKR
jgi:hypothetical protein